MKQTFQVTIAHGTAITVEDVKKALVEGLSQNSKLVESELVTYVEEVK